MPKCTICYHPEKEKLNVALANGTPVREIEKFFKVSKSALSRHNKFCLPMIIAAALRTNPPSEDGEEGPEPGTVKGRAEEMVGRSRLAILQALKRKDYKVAFAGMREHRGYTEIVGRINGELNPGSGGGEHRPMFILPEGTSVSVVVTASPAPAELRDVTPLELPENTSN